MLSERPKLRGAYHRDRTSFLTWLVCAIIAGFAVQWAFSLFGLAVQVGASAGFSAAAFWHGQPWKLLTYPLVHENLLHLVSMALALHFVGREIVPAVSERRLFWLALAATAVAGALWFGFHFDHSAYLVGASPILWTYFALFVFLFPNRRISFLIFFIVPITLRPKYVALTVLTVDLFGALLLELHPDRLAGYSVPHSAHLGAWVVAWVYFRYFHTSDEVEQVRRQKRVGRPESKSPEPTGETLAAAGVQLTVDDQRKVIRAEVDRILDKISATGLDSLTPAEQRVLAEARNHIGQR